MNLSTASRIVGIAVVVLTLGLTTFGPIAKVHADIIPVGAVYNQYQQGVYVMPVSCVLSTSSDTIQNGQAGYLSWTSYGATTAILSDGIGNVAANGAITVRPASSRTYTLTVYGDQGQTSQCSTALTVSGENPYTPNYGYGVGYQVQNTYPTYGYGYGASQVTLTQIPYTGFDFGTTGDMVMWLSIVGFAASALYLLYYYRLQRA